MYSVSSFNKISYLHKFGCQDFVAFDIHQAIAFIFSTDKRKMICYSTSHNCTLQNLENSSFADQTVISEPFLSFIYIFDISSIYIYFRHHSISVLITRDYIYENLRKITPLGLHICDIYTLFIFILPSGVKKFLIDLRQTILCYGNRKLSNGSTYLPMAHRVTSSISAKRKAISI